MHQLLPKIQGNFKKYLHPKKGSILPLNNKRSWIDFISLVEKSNKISEVKKKSILKSLPSFVNGPLKDALSIKEDNDRFFTVSVALSAMGKEPWEFSDILFALELFDSSILLVDIGNEILSFL